MSELTNLQQSALKRDKNIAVTAGAGTGKTFILVERYLDILLNEDVDIRNVLAITFTNKAAAEMVDRVAQSIAELLDGEKDLKRKERIHTLRNRLSSAYISTIHAFCTRLLKEFPVQANVEPDFATLNEMQAEQLLEQAREEEIKSLNSSPADFIDLFRLFGEQKIGQMLSSALDNRFRMREILKYMDSLEVDSFCRDLQDEYVGWIKSEILPTVFITASAEVDRLLSADCSRAMGNKNAEKVLTALQAVHSFSDDQPEYFEALFKLASVMTTSKGLPYKDLKQMGGKGCWTAAQGESLVQFSEFLAPLKKWAHDNRCERPGEIDKLVLLALKKLYELYRNVESNYRQKKKALSALDFEDLQIMALDLLKHNEEIRHEISGRFRYIMVDEFQDTNRLQWEIIELIAADREDALFVVGDPKQSIYGFRQADVRVFKEVRDKFADGQSLKDYPGDIVFEDSFRFKETVNAFINFTFRQILQVNAGNPWQVGYDPLTSKRKDRAGGRVSVAMLPKDGPGEARFIAGQILKMHEERKRSFGDIAILLRARTNLQALEETLRSQGIPFVTTGGVGFYQRQEVYDVYHLVRFLLDPHEDLSTVALLRSPFCNLSDIGLYYLSTNEDVDSFWEKVLQYEVIDTMPDDDKTRLKIFCKNASRWLQRRDRIGFAELLRQIFTESYYSPIMASEKNALQLLANLEKILDSAAQFENNGIISLYDFAEALKQLISRDPREGEAQDDTQKVDAVQIMTIHASKGLQFPVVFLPWLSSKPQAIRGVLFDEQLGTLNKPLLRGLPASINERTYFLYNRALNVEKKKLEAETRRIFYVGCTRAQDELVLTATGINENSQMDWLCNALNISTVSESDPAVTFDSKYFYELICESEIEAEKRTTPAKHFENNIRRAAGLIRSENKMKETPLFLQRPHQQPRGETFSATQLMTYLDDPDSYFKRYHLGFFESDYEHIAALGDENNVAILKGKLIHRYLEKYPEVAEDQLFYELEIFDHSLREAMRGELNVIQQRLRESRALRSIMQVKLARTEVAITTRLGDDYLTGTLDRLYLDEKSRWCVADYKTNRVSKAQVAAAAEKYRPQMEVYGLLVQALHPNQAIYPVALYFSHPDEIFLVEFEVEHLNNVRQKLLHAVRGIQQFPPYLLP